MSNGDTEVEHGVLVYDTTMKVPLIVSWPGKLPAGNVVQKGGRLVDLFPTIAELLGWDPPADVDGASLASACRTGQGRFLPTYVESLYPMISFGWAPLRSLITEDYKFIGDPPKFR